MKRLFIAFALLSLAACSSSPSTMDHASNQRPAVRKISSSDPSWETVKPFHDQAIADAKRLVGKFNQANGTACISRAGWLSSYADSHLVLVVPKQIDDHPTGGWDDVTRELVSYAGGQPHVVPVTEQAQEDAYGHYKFHYKYRETIDGKQYTYGWDRGTEFDSGNDALFDSAGDETTKMSCFGTGDPEYPVP